MNLLRIRRCFDRSTRRRKSVRPLCEDLEGRKLLSGLAGNHAGASSLARVQVASADASSVNATNADGHVKWVQVANAAILFPVFAQ